MRTASSSTPSPIFERYKGTDSMADKVTQDLSPLLSLPSNLELPFVCESNCLPSDDNNEAKM